MTLVKGTLVKLDGEDWEIVEIKERNTWAKEGRFEPKEVDLLGMGIIGRNVVTNKCLYFYDFDLDT